MRFSLQSGLTLRFGANTYELVRQLECDEFQFEETKTRRSKIMTKDDIVQGVYSKKFEVVLAVVEVVLFVDVVSTSQCHNGQTMK